MTAFDPLAATYDDTFTNTQIGQYLRQRVRARLDVHFQPGDHVLELGCGTGEDALYLARRGVQVTATDSSEAMLDITRAKTQGNPLVRVEKLDLLTLTLNPSPLWRGTLKASFLSSVSRAKEADDERGGYDGVFANFGPVNVLEDWRPLATWLAAQIKPGGIVGLGVMGPLCLWELGWHGLHLDFRTAFRRLRGPATFQADDKTAPINIYYPTIARLERDFSPYFRRVHLAPVGLFLPPSDVFGVLEKRSRLLRRLIALEDRFARFSWLARFADHYWIEFQKI